MCIYICIYVYTYTHMLHIPTCRGFLGLPVAVRRQAFHLVGLVLAPVGNDSNSNVNINSDSNSNNHGNILVRSNDNRSNNYRNTWVVLVSNSSCIVYMCCVLLLCNIDVLLSLSSGSNSYDNTSNTRVIDMVPYYKQ